MKKKLNIAFFLDSFPGISETFIVNQIVALLKDGHYVKIFAKSRSKNHHDHSIVAEFDLIKKVCFLDKLPPSRFGKIRLLFSRLLHYPSRRNFRLIGTYFF